MGFGDTQISRPGLAADYMPRPKVGPETVMVLPIDAPAPARGRYLELPGSLETGLAGSCSIYMDVKIN